jgi:hypothetical protein
MTSKKLFPIKTETACQLKWAWSTVYLSTGKTASCHRTHQTDIITEPFNFHNTPGKIQDRERMLEGQWPTQGCEYCKNIEAAGGASDRTTNLEWWDFEPSKELQANPLATSVTPQILEIYFSNVCNLKCVYCGPQFSSLWADELRRYEELQFEMDSNFESNKQKCFEWIHNNVNDLHTLNVLGGEPLYQDEFDQLLDVLENGPNSTLKLTFFSNLAVTHAKLTSKIDRIEQLINQGKIRELIITASLDCWGPEAEYARFPLNLATWEKNFNYLLDKPWITMVINSTITPLTIKSFPALIEKINKWNNIRHVYNYCNSVNWPNHMFIDIFGNVFEDDFNCAIENMPNLVPEHSKVTEYLKGIRDQVKHSQPNKLKIKQLYTTLEQLDSRRNTNWRVVYPWLEVLFNKHIGE